MFALQNAFLRNLIISIAEKLRKASFLHFHFVTWKGKQFESFVPLIKTLKLNLPFFGGW